MESVLVVETCSVLTKETDASEVVAGLTPLLDNDVTTESVAETGEVELALTEAEADTPATRVADVEVSDGTELTDEDESVPL